MKTSTDKETTSETEERPMRDEPERTEEESVSNRGDSDALQGEERGTGFYFQLGLGFGIGFDGISFKAPKSSGRITGGLASGEIALGASIQPGISIGGAIAGEYMPVPQEKIEDQDSRDLDASVLGMVGPFFDWRLRPRADSWHFQAMLAFAHLAVVDNQSWSANGASAELGGGYEWWVGGNFSLGVLARTTLAILIGDENTNGYVAISALGTATYN
jgi:hypothetical protein